MEEVLKKYKKLNLVLSEEEERAKIYEYIYYTNKLEGNNLTLLQTTSIIDKGIVSGQQISLRDILEHKGMYKALQRMFKALHKKEVLSTKLIVELNGLILGSLFQLDETYVSAKEKGQKINQTKVTQNYIRITKPSGDTQIIEPLSSPKNALENLEELVKTVLKSKKDIYEKSAYLLQEMWLHQPFIDGNKRTARLLINFLTMQQGYPLFAYNNEAKNINSLLVEQYLFNKEALVKNYIKQALKNEVNNYLNIKKQTKDNNLGFRMLL